MWIFIICQGINMKKNACKLFAFGRIIKTFLNIFMKNVSFFDKISKENWPHFAVFDQVFLRFTASPKVDTPGRLHQFSTAISDLRGNVHVPAFPIPNASGSVLGVRLAKLGLKGSKTYQNTIQVATSKWLSKHKHILIKYEIFAKT